MPFIPVDDYFVHAPCMSPSHLPPNMMVIRVPMRWQCPSCGHQTDISPMVADCIGSQVDTYGSDPGTYC